MSTTAALEIAVTSPAGAITARDGGADRVELCVGLELGGLTPSQALVETTHETGIPAHALVRCRPGGFVHSPDEVELMVREVRTVLRSGAAGVVVGALRPDRTLDEDALRRFVDAARSVSTTAEITLHRAIDHAIDPVAAAGSLAALGFTRVLTSGAAPTAVAGAETIARMVGAAGPVQVMAGAGVTPADVRALLATGAAAVHLSAKRPAAGSTHAGVPMGAGDDGSAHFVTDAEVVTAARRALDA
ncbi:MULTISPECIES: copper homeostasis protein CutC [Curtobacterium]|uniref:copper homeostasis protein CutC n=1 Tax=Curtobacterium TaxID=2034 RepID=UPI0003756955|nr:MULTISPECIES: copper homeostasis protein CutC [Curtobacterium]EYT66332.1 copper homeostasis protein CutC [Curtobacterium flaccumfaciens UCD-AKU]KQR26599.1 copper homeostasis protein CutC [Curtobacterium sp. Leaf154]MCS6563913.1 copper homeostasis protein CutC [Curtobacterium flaccumfaciens pv. flaccumfaciens]MCS6577485.1 copper homeostasis protein CutC [Curtobacterium flaccumfaciens]MCU0115921.1 copper homeostasis protein CutC [Curtobacterium flaccumfaciens]